jgi:hypothetical protein
MAGRTRGKCNRALSKAKLAAARNVGMRQLRHEPSQIKRTALPNTGTVGGSQASREQGRTCTTDINRLNPVPHGLSARHFLAQGL